MALSVLVSAAALLAFMWLAWTLITRDQQKRFDSELETIANRFAPRLADLTLRPNPGDANNPATDIFWTQLADEAPLYLLINGNGESQAQSEHWPAELPASDFTSYALPSPFPNFPQGPGPNDPNAPAAATPPKLTPGIARMAYDNFLRNASASLQYAGFGNPDGGGPGNGANGFGGPNRGGGGPGGRGFGRGPGGPGGRGGRNSEPLTRVDQIVFLSKPDAKAVWRLAVVPAAGGVAVFGRPLASLDAERSQVRDTFLFALPVALALIGAGAWLLANRAVAPVNKLSRATEQITAEGLHERISRGGEDAEFARLIDVFNGMLNRLELSFEQARRFSHDAAHELNTPLAVLMGQIDQSLHAAPVGSDEQQRWTILAEEVQHLRDIVRKLLLLARADRGALHPEYQPCDLARLANECLEDVAAGTNGLQFSYAGETAMPMEGDPALLRPILLNLLSNAAKYNREGGSVKLQLLSETRAGRPWVRLIFTNTGPALPPEKAAHIFDRFFRNDTVRTGGNSNIRGGLGLGLSLAREFARAHGGDLMLAANIEDAITFQLDLPVNHAKAASADAPAGD